MTVVKQTGSIKDQGACRFIMKLVLGFCVFQRNKLRCRVRTKPKLPCKNVKFLGKPVSSGPIPGCNNELPCFLREVPD